MSSLAPLQLYILNREDLNRRNHFNVCEFYECLESFTEKQLRTAVGLVVQRHIALRSLFHQRQGQWIRECWQGADDRIVNWVDLADIKDEDLSRGIEKVAEEFQGSLDLIEGPLMRVVYFDTGPGRNHRLLVIIHHALVDGVSLNLVVAELWSLLHQLKSGASISASAEVGAFPAWCDALDEYVSDGLLARDAELWLNQPWAKVRPLVARSDIAGVTEPQMKQLKASFDRDCTRAMTAYVGRKGFHLIDVISAAAMRVARDWSGSRVVSLAAWNHGRTSLNNGVDLSREVGPFAYFWPMVLDLHSLTDDLLLQQLYDKRSADQPLLCGFTLGRYSGRHDQVARLFQAIPVPEIAVNFIGRQRPIESGGGVQKAGEFRGSLRHATDLDQFRLIGIYASLQNGSLQVAWSYSTAVYEESEMENALAHFRRQVLRIAQPE